MDTIDSLDIDVEIVMEHERSFDCPGGEHDSFDAERVQPLARRPALDPRCSVQRKVKMAHYCCEGGIPYL